MAWDKNKPSGNMPLNVSDDAIRDNWAALEEALSKEHYFPSNNPDKFGRHTEEFIQSIIDRINSFGGTNHSTSADHAKTADNATNADNADKLDNYDTSITRQPNTIPVSDSEGYLNNWIKQGESSGLDADKIRGLPGDFSCSKDTNGYTKLPNGIIIQWGVVGGLQGDWESQVDFPIQFPNVCLTVTATADVPFNADQWATVRNVTNAGFMARMEYYGGNKAEGSIRWIAIGY